MKRTERSSIPPVGTFNAGASSTSNCLDAKVGRERRGECAGGGSSEHADEHGLQLGCQRVDRAER
jgi:hypothetical protein